jgi:hypothetical protein
LLSRDEMDARTKRKVEAVIKRERALAYAYSHQVRCRAVPCRASRRRRGGGGVGWTDVVVVLRSGWIRRATNAAKGTIWYEKYIV